MSKNYYFTRNEVRRGPYTAQQMRQLAADGVIVATDGISADGSDRVVRADRVANLFPPPGGVSGARRLPDTKIDQPVSAPTAHVAADLPAASDVAPDPVGAPPEPAVAEAPAAAAEVAAPTIAKERAAPPHIRKARAVAGRGVVIVGQDGATVKIRKKCVKCGHEDRNWTNMPIRNGVNSATFFCPKCRKRREVHFQGIVT